VPPAAALARPEALLAEDVAVVDADAATGGVAVGGGASGGGGTGIGGGAFGLDIIEPIGGLLLEIEFIFNIIVY